MIKQCFLLWLSKFTSWIAGYDLLFPSSWTSHGFAQVVIYIKSSLEYEQIHELQDDLIQSIWVKTGFKNSRKILFCHTYREHTSALGNSLRCQREHLEKFLQQWKAALQVRNNSCDPNEIHIAGDMNLDALNGRWLNPDYSLFSLANMV